MTPMDHYLQALAHIAAATLARQLLDDEFEGPYRDNAKINDLQAKVGMGLKLAQIHADLAQAQALAKLVAA